MYGCIVFSTNLRLIMNFLARQPVAVLGSARGAYWWGVHVTIGRGTVPRHRGAVLFRQRPITGRNFSVSPIFCGGISKVPGSGARDGWSEALLTLDSKGAASSDAVQAVAEAAAEHGADLASLGLGAWYTPVGQLQLVLDALQASTGLPWWGLIGIATMVMRILLFPLSVKFAVNAAKMAKIQPEVAEIMKKIQHFASIGAKELQEKEQIKMADLYKNNNCSPLTMMALPFMQMPVFMSFFIALRKMALAPLDSMKTGGMAWFSDLTVADPIYTLPLIACGVFISNIQVWIWPFHQQQYRRSCYLCGSDIYANLLKLFTTKFMWEIYM